MDNKKFAELDIFIKKVYKNEPKFLGWLNSRNNVCYCVASAVQPTHGFCDALSDTASDELSFNQISRDTLQNRIDKIKYSDKFQPFLLNLMNIKHLDPVDVYKGALIDRKAFSKIKSDENYHPKKLTALCLCIGLKLNIDQAKDLLRRAGYTFSAADLTDIIFLYYIEKSNYDIYEIDEALLKYNLPTITRYD